MAFQVNGTTRIDDGRNLVNIVDREGFVADAIAASAAQDVGTYAFLGRDTGNYIAQAATRSVAGDLFGDTRAGSGLFPFGVDGVLPTTSNYSFCNFTATGRSGTWRCMGHADNTSVHPWAVDHFVACLYLRIS